MPTSCSCGFELWTIEQANEVTTMCRRCDTVAIGGGRREGPPATPGTKGTGQFNAPFGDR